MPDGLPTFAARSETAQDGVLVRGDGKPSGEDGSTPPERSSQAGPVEDSGGRRGAGPLIAPPVIGGRGAAGRRPPVPWWSSGRSSWLVSCLFHAVVLVILGLVSFGVRFGMGEMGLTASLRRARPSGDVESENLVPLAVSPAERVMPQEIDHARPRVELPVELPVPAERELGAGIGLAGSLPANVFQGIMGGGLGDRSRQARAAWVGKGGDGGPTGRSEEAVERGLRWLVAHQLADGSWHFNHNDSLCQGMCRNPGSVTTTTGATAMALLAFLGAGYTHQTGEHRDPVRRGLYYLQSRGLVCREGIDLQEGTMYAQGLATIALSEAYAMTGDRTFRPVAQGAVDFIVAAQDLEGGGWRYRPHEPGDTTVTGWQIMALKSADLAGLRVPSPAFFRAQEFLTGVQSEDGARYGYMSTDPRRTTTAIGLLCRMYAGWGHDHRALQQGVGYLSRWGPSEQDIYYDYYATQVMFHWQGSDWKRWSVEIRDSLVASQATRGHESGSWFFPEQSTASGGRLCSTALAVMTLEVYYRYLPLYGPEAFDD